MADKKISAMPDLAGAQIAATQLTLRLTTGAPGAQNVRSSLTDFFANAVSASIFAFNADPRTSGSSSYFRIKTPADTTLTAGTESIGIQLGGSAAGGTVTRQFATGAIAMQREIVCFAPTYSAVAASVFTDVSTFAVSGAPIAGANVTLSNPRAVWVQTGALEIGTHSGFTPDAGTNFLYAAGQGTAAFQSTSAAGYSGVNLYNDTGTLSASFQYGNSGVGLLPDTFFFGPRNGTAAMVFVSGAGATERGRMTNAGLFSFNAGASPGGQVHAVASTSSTIGLRIDSTSGSTVDLATWNLNTTATNAVANMLTFDTRSSGAVTNGFGAGFTWTLESSTTDAQTAATLRVKWFDATHASRTSAIVFGAVLNGTLADKCAVQGGGNFAAVSVSQLGWSSSSTDPTLAIDTGLARFAAAGIRVTNGSTGAGNLLIGTSAGAIGASGAGVLAFTLSTAPTNFPTDTIQLYSRDAAAGDAQLIVANEGGRLSRLTGRVSYVVTQFNKTSDTTLADVPMDQAIQIEASTRYSFEVTAYTTSNINGGVKFSIAGTATVTSVIYEALVFETALIAVQTRATALGTTVGSVQAVTAALAIIRGTILVNAAGTLTLQFAQNTSNAAASSVLVGSCFKIWQS